VVGGQVVVGLDALGHDRVQGFSGGAAGQLGDVGGQGLTDGFLLLGTDLVKAP